MTDIYDLKKKHSFIHYDVNRNKNDKNGMHRLIELKKLLASFFICFSSQCFV